MKIKCRIALSVDHKGGWSAAGWNGADDRSMRSSTVDSLEEGEKQYWIEVEVETPVAEIIKAEAL